MKPEIVSVLACDNEHISCDNAFSDENNSNDIGDNNVHEILNFSDSSSGNDNEFPDEGRCPETSENDLRKDLANWCLHYNVSHSSCSALLKILKKFHNELPADARTLLGTHSIECISVGEGSFVYFGIVSQLLENVSLDKDSANTLFLNINIDGIPIYKSQGISFWPILCSVSLDRFVVTNVHVKPFIVAVYCGKKKPDVDPFLKDFCEEINRILSNGITIDNKKFPVCIRAVIADAPAKAMIKQIRGHGGYYACDRCFVKWIKKIYILLRIML